MALDAPAFRLAFAPSMLRDLASRYSYPEGDARIEGLVPEVRESGLLTKANLLAVVRWKSQRRLGLVAGTRESTIVEATRVALSAQSEELRIGVLTLIPGVGIPTASVVLHWFHADPYPIVDFRALWSLGVNTPPTYTFPFWAAYVRACRELAFSTGLTMRDLDRALWQYSKEQQPAAGAERE